MKESLSDALRTYAAGDVLPMHMPGHKRDAARFPWLVGCEVDITEIDGFDDLNDPRGLFWELSQRMAHLWGAKRSVPLVNGSTVGILAAMWTCLARGGTALIARGCHKSVYHGCELLGCGVRYLLPEADRWGIWRSVTPEAVEAALAADSSVRLVVVTSPTYEGVISDIAGIAAVCHRRGVPLLVDEAHGAHLGFGGFPKSAVSQGADLVVQSLHKTLPSPTQTAVLHIGGGLIDGREAARNVAMLQSSSPSYLLSSGIDGCVRYMEERGEDACRRWRELLEAFDREAESLRRLHILFRRPEAGIFAYDPSKLVLAGPAGPVLMGRLREEFHIELEMASARYALAMTGLGDSEAALSRLLAALRVLDGTLPEAEAPSFPAASLPEQRLRLAEAALLPRAPVTLSDAVGRVSGEYVWAYPPGAPLLVPGEVVDGGVLARMAALAACGVTLHSTERALPESLYCIA